MSAEQIPPFSYVPRYIEGELLYAWVARLHSLNACNDARQTLQTLFGSRTGIPSADIPCRLQTFIDRTATWGPFSSIPDVSSRGTLLPYFTRFMSPERKEITVAAVALSRGEGLKAKMGLVANGFGASTMLKSCRLCDADCIRHHGCRTWLRIHQLPGVWICPIHLESLSCFLVQSHQPHRQSLLQPINTNTQNLASGVEGNRYCLQRITVLSAETLALDVPTVPAIDRAKTYLDAIADQGWVIHGRINWDELAKCICSEYKRFSSLSFQKRLLSSERNPLRWVQDLCLRPNRALHPICHLLLAGFLFGDIKSFFTAAQRNKVANKSFPNPERGSGSRNVSLDHSHSTLLKDTTLSCREVAARTGFSVTTIVLKRRALRIPVAERRKSFTQSRLVEITELLQAGHPAATVAKLSGVSLSSIYRMRAVIALPPSFQGKDDFDKKRDQYRSNWKLAQVENPTARTNVLRAVAGAAYAWLYRHDREWLHSNSPARLTDIGTHNGKRVSWPDRDRELAAIIKEAALHSAAKRNKNRISCAFLLRATGKEAMVERNAAKLPLVCKALLEYSEDDATFYQRRRQYAVDDLINQGNLAPEDWQIDRAAGIRKRMPG